MSASAARKATGPQARTPKPTLALTAVIYAFRPSRPPQVRKATALMEKAAMTCPLCHNKYHGPKKCGYGLRAGYVTKHNMEKAKTQLKVLDLGKGSRAKLGKNPSASVSQAPPLAPSSKAAPQARPSFPPSPTQSIPEDMDEFIAMAAEAMGEEEEDVAGAVSLSDDEESLVEAGSILSREE